MSHLPPPRAGVQRAGGAFSARLAECTFGFCGPPPKRWVPHREAITPSKQPSRPRRFAEGRFPSRPALPSAEESRWHHAVSGRTAQIDGLSGSAAGDCLLASKADDLEGNPHPPRAPVAAAAGKVSHERRLIWRAMQMITSAKKMPTGQSDSFRKRITLISGGTQRKSKRSAESVIAAGCCR